MIAGRRCTPDQPPCYGPASEHSGWPGEALPVLKRRCRAEIETRAQACDGSTSKQDTGQLAHAGCTFTLAVGTYSTEQVSTFVVGATLVEFTALVSTEAAASSRLRHAYVLRWWSVRCRRSSEHVIRSRE